MPGYHRAELTAELRVVATGRAGEPSEEQVEAARRVAGGTGLAREAGPETILLAGDRREVLEAAMEIVEAALDAGAHTVEVRVETEGEADRFGP